MYIIERKWKKEKKEEKEKKVKESKEIKKEKKKGEKDKFHCIQYQEYVPSKINLLVLWLTVSYFRGLAKQFLKFFFGGVQ